MFCPRTPVKVRLLIPTSKLWSTPPWLSIVQTILFTNLQLQFIKKYHRLQQIRPTFMPSVPLTHFSFSNYQRWILQFYAPWINDYFITFFLFNVWWALSGVFTPPLPAFNNQCRTTAIAKVPVSPSFFFSSFSTFLTTESHLTCYISSFSHIVCLSRLYSSRDPLIY